MAVGTPNKIQGRGADGRGKLLFTKRSAGSSFPPGKTKASGMKAEADEALARDIALRYEEAEENVLF